MTREQQMMDAAEAYAAEIYKDEPDNFHTDEQLCETINDFCAGWRAADNSRWMPVEEELPKQDGRYWCCDDDGGQEELIWKDGNWYGVLDAYPIYGITHWMPMSVPQRKE